MANTKKATHVVTHPKLQLMHEGKLQHMPVGTPLVLSKKVGDLLEAKNQVAKYGATKTIDKTADDESSSESKEK